MAPGIEVADALSQPHRSEKGEVHFVHHGFLLGRFAESIDVPTRVAALCMALIVSFLCSMVVPTSVCGSWRRACSWAWITTSTRQVSGTAASDLSQVHCEHGLQGGDENNLPTLSIG